MAPDRKQAEQHKDRGNAHMQGGRFEQAIREYRKALQSDAGYPNAYCNLGLALAEAGKPEDAERAYLEGIAKADFAMTRYNYGLLLKRCGRIQEAIAQHTRAVELAPESAGFLLVGRAAAHAHAGDARAAAGDVCASVFATEGLVDGAALERPEFPQIESAARKDPAAAALLAGLKILAGGTSDATSARAAKKISRAVEAAGDWPEAHYALGRALMRADDWNAGQTAFRRALDLAKKQDRTGEPLFVSAAKFLGASPPA
jgi:tetratricopeptide (TPR) repeat protein